MNVPSRIIEKNIEQFPYINTEIVLEIEKYIKQFTDIPQYIVSEKSIREIIENFFVGH